MNIEEAKANIGAEVVLLEDTKPYMYKSKKSVANSFAKNTVLKIHAVANDSVLIHTKNFTTAIVNLEHIALKEPKMQNYKIKVANEAESKEAQELLFELGYKWFGNGEKYNKTLDGYFIIANSGGFIFQSLLEFFCCKEYEEHQEITLPQLRDLAVLHRNDVSDATHTHGGDKYYIGAEVYYWSLVDKWDNCTTNVQYALDKCTPIHKNKEPQMTWQDALRAVLDGKEVEIFRDGKWQSINEKFKDEGYRLAPQRKILNGNFTKEELLKIAGEME